jgi:hypothetical protein
MKSSFVLQAPSFGICGWCEFTFGIGGVIFHALSHLQQLLACFWHFGPLEDLLVHPRLQAIKKKTTFWVYSSFIGTRYNKKLKVCTCFASEPNFYPCLSANNSNPSLRTWLWGMNFALNSTLNPIQAMVGIAFEFSSLKVPHHLKAWP